MKIGVKLGLSFGGVMLALLAIVYFSISGMSELNDDIDSISHSKVPKMIWATTIRSKANESARALRNAMITTSKDEQKKQLDRAISEAVSAGPFFDSLSANCVAPEEKSINEKIADARPKFGEDRKYLISLIEADKREEATNVLFTQLRESQTKVFEAINEMVALQMKETNQAGIEARNTYTSLRFEMIVLSIVILLIVVGLSIIITRNIVKPLTLAVEAANKIAQGDINVKLDHVSNDETGVLIKSMKTMTTSISALIDDAKVLTQAAADGKLDIRANAEKHKGAYREIVLGINGSLDAVISPLNVAAEYIDRISKGDMPPLITDNFKGDFNEIKNNLNQCIDAIKLMISDAKNLSQAAIEGKLDVRADASKHLGDFRKIVQGVNDTLDAVIGPLNVAAEYIDRISKGDIPPKISDNYNGDFNEIKNNINQLIDTMKTILTGVERIVVSVENGNLNDRAHYEILNGDWRKLVQGINNIILAFVDPFSMATVNIERISNGDIPQPITENYKGDFNNIKNNLNKCFAAVKLMITDANMLAQAAIDGKLDIRADASKHQGDFRTIIQGVNDTLDSVIGPLNVAAEYVDRISKGDMPPLITDTFKGDFNEIKNNLNQCIDAIKSLIQDSGNLSESAVEGKLDARAEILRHQGDFRRIVQGINGTLDAITEPMNEAANVLSVMATGDLTHKMDGEYRGDYQTLKTNVNSVISSLNELIKEISDAVESVSGASLEISGAADAIAASSSEQSSQADEVASAVEMMSRTITENAMAASRTAQEAENNGKIAKEGGEVVAQTVNKMKDIAFVVKQSADNIEKLGESSKQIGEIISVIDDIADQTNLLALNAAIEAARAGEQGRGFAVVADEVRKLAERTTEATKQIASMIKGIQSETQEAVSAMKLGNEEVNSGIALADKAGKALNQILASTQELQLMISQIAVASEEQSATSEEIAKNVNSISHVTNDSARRIQEIAKASEEMEKLTGDLKHLVKQFRTEDEIDVYSRTRQKSLSNSKNRLAAKSED
jgi:methyl-accepting chemotaxis protein